MISPIVLVVEPSSKDRELLVLALSRYSVVAVSNRSAALKEAQDADIEAAVLHTYNCDSGVGEFLDSLRALVPKLPVVFIVENPVDNQRWEVFPNSAVIQKTMGAWKELSETVESLINATVWDSSWDELRDEVSKLRVANQTLRSISAKLHAEVVGDEPQ